MIFFPTTFVLFSCICSLSRAQSSTSSSTRDPSPTTSTSPVTQTPANFTYPNYLGPFVVQLFSVQDTIRTSWYPLPENKTATLQIVCWQRNGTKILNWGGDPPTYQKNLTSFSSSTSEYDVPLQDYADFDPCQFSLWDAFDGVDSMIESGAFGINMSKPASGTAHTWSVDNPGPVGDIRTTLKSSGGVRKSSLLDIYSVAFYAVVFVFFQVAL